MLTVGELKRALADISDDLPVVVTSTEWDYNDAYDVLETTMDWIDSGSDREHMRQRHCVVIE